MARRQAIMSLIIIPKITEKRLVQATQGVYTFTVPMTTNKIELARAIKEQYKVDAVDIRISIAKGKVKKFRQIKGRRVDVKKAYVQVAKGQKIAAFDMGQEEAPKDEKKAKKVAKKAEKAVKEEKK